MTYRNDQDALNNRKQQLELRLAELRAKIQEGNQASQALDGTVKELEELYAEYNSYNAKTNTRRALPLLQRIYVASPCNVPWESMQGDDHVRHCGSCDKQVFDLSSLTTAEAESLLAKNNNICAQYYRRADGTILTADCPVGVAKKTKQRRKAAVIAATIASSVAGAALASAFFSRADEEHETCSSGAVPTSQVSTPPTQTLPVNVTDKPPQPVTHQLNTPPVTPPTPQIHQMRGAVSVHRDQMVRGDLAMK
jgi:hypothetical protein